MSYSFSPKQRPCLEGDPFLDMEGEFKVKLAPKVAGKKLAVFKTHKNDDVKWEDAKMKRENEFQPWKIKTGSGQASRRYKANRIGGFDASSEYFVFHKRGDAFEVCHVDESYNVVADKRYKTLTDEQAEEAYAKREKIFNQAGLMVKKDSDEPGGSSDSKSFKISEMDDWDGPDDFSASEGEEGDTTVKKKPKKRTVKEEEDVPEEGKEDSDEGDFEQREVDYISESSSESESEKGDDQDEVKELGDLLASDEEGEEDPDGAPKPIITENPPELKPDPNANGSDESDDDGDDDDIDEEAMDSMFMKKSLPAALVKEASASSQPSQSVANKRKPDDTPPASTSAPMSTPAPPPKRPCPPVPNSIEKTMEDLIKKYLTRKPTTLKTLLKDIKTKLKRMGSTDLELKDRIHSIADIIRRLNPEKQRLNDETFLFLKS